MLLSWSKTGVKAWQSYGRKGREVAPIVMYLGKLTLSCIDDERCVQCTSEQRRFVIVMGFQVGNPVLRHGWK